jgi:hypothetical protein
MQVNRSRQPLSSLSLNDENIRNQDITIPKLKKTKRERESKIKIRDDNATEIATILGDLHVIVATYITDDAKRIEAIDLISTLSNSLQLKPIVDTGVQAVATQDAVEKSVSDHDTKPSAIISEECTPITVGEEVEDDDNEKTLPMDDAPTAPVTPIEDPSAIEVDDEISVNPRVLFSNSMATTAIPKPGHVAFPLVTLAEKLTLMTSDMELTIMRTMENYENSYGANQSEMTQDPVASQLPLLEVQCISEEKSNRYIL